MNDLTRRDLPKRMPFGVPIMIDGYFAGGHLSRSEGQDCAILACLTNFDEDVSHRQMTM
jgi:hypothetical protein